MALVTGTAFGVTAQTEIYIEGAPQVYYGDIAVPYMFAPDSDGFYWNLSGTSTYPVYQLGCYEGVTFSDNITINQVRCDTFGDKDMIMRRNYLELRFTLKSFFPFATLSAAMNGGAVTRNLSSRTEKFGLGIINNAKYYRVYFPAVYDESAGDYVAITGHRAKFVSTGELTMAYGNAWSLPVTLRLLADATKPSAQTFATVIRSDYSDITS